MTTPVPNRLSKHLLSKGTPSNYAYENHLTGQKGQSKESEKDHVSCPEAVRRMVREALKQYKSVSSNAEPLNQLGLFDTVQVDIFNNTSKSID